MYDDIFYIPHENDQFIVYIPFKGIIALGNNALVRLFQKANSGDKTALQKLGITEQFFLKENSSERAIKYGKPQNHLSKFVPESVSLFLTNNCPLRCLYCYAEGGKNKLNMPWDIVTGILDEIAENVVSAGSKKMTVNFHGGGDVTSAWGLLVRTRKYLQEIADRNDIQLNTSIGLSGVLQDKQCQWIIQNINGATVSLDGDPDNNIHRILANGNPSFPYVDATLKRFDKAEYNYGLRCTVTEDTVLEMEHIVRFFCENYLVKHIMVEPMFPVGRANTTGVRSPSAQQFVEQFRKAHSVAQSFGRTLIYSGARITTLSNSFCQATNDSCAVTPEGWITSCYEVLDVDNPSSHVFFYGRYNRETRRMEVDDKRRKNLFNLTVLNRPGCSTCFCKWHCAGDCPVKALQSEVLEESEYPDRCYINRMLTKDQLLENLSAEF